jgi:cytochrome c
MRSFPVMIAMALVALPAVARAQDAGAGQSVFRSQCAICHSPQSGRNLIGPSLFGVVGRASGGVPGFHYSPANETSHLTWDAATLDRYLENPRAVVPGTIMAYAGVKDAQKRADLIAYLVTLK